MAGITMSAKKTLQQRQTELQALLTTPLGQKELEQLESQYHAASGRWRAENTSVITYILVHERARGLLRS